MKKSKKIGLIIVSILIVVSMAVGGFVLLQKIVQIYPISELDNVKSPHLDLREMETSVRLEIKESDFQNRIILFVSPWQPDKITQAFSGYDKNSSKLLERYISLSTTYYELTFPQKVEWIYEKDVDIHNFLLFAEPIEDSRFDRCVILEDFSMQAVMREDQTGYDEAPRNDAKILVVKDRHLMFVEYVGGRLTKDDILDELARVLA
jgi:hypothetical protein